MADPEAGEVLIRVMAAVIRRGDRYLVCQRPLRKRHGGLWEFPGGKLEAGESDEDAIRRELHEELGVSLVGCGEELFSVCDAGSHFLIVFRSVMIEGEPAPLEHVRLAWAVVEEIAELPLAPSDRQFLRHLSH